MAWNILLHIIKASFSIFCLILKIGIQCWKLLFIKLFPLYPYYISSPLLSNNYWWNFIICKVWILSEFTLLSNTLYAILSIIIVWILSEFTLLSNWQHVFFSYISVWILSEFTLLSNLNCERLHALSVWILSEFTLLSNLKPQTSNLFLRENSFRHYVTLKFR